MAGTFRKCTAFGKRFCSRNTLLRKPFLHINNYRLPKHFDRWMEIFTSTTDEFAGATAEEAKLRAKNMAEMFNYKINYFRNAGKWRSSEFEITPCAIHYYWFFFPLLSSLALV
jgi:hypothetical protein